MKNTKKALGIILAIVMLFAMSIPTFAHTIKITGTTASPTDGHTYTVYQLFTGEISQNEEGENVLINVEYGRNYTPDGHKVGDAVTKADLDQINDANAFAKTLYEGDLLTGTYATLNAANDWTEANAPAGYYLIVDTTDPLPEGHTRSAYIVEVVEDVDIAPKSSTTTVIKKVKDINDSKDSDISDNEWTDTADHDIGDVVPFQVKANFSDLSEYDSYYAIITDTMSKGLTYNNDAVITMTYTVKGAEASATKTLDITPVVTDYVAEDADDKYAGGKVITITIEDLKALVEGDLVSASITVDYTATLNENAVIGAAGNPNKVNLTYDREPDQDGGGHTTPDDVNVVFTFKANVNKVDEQNKPLTGAEFKLEKKLADGSWKTIQTVKNDEGTVFSFLGLDDGDYRITETVAPSGYNKIDAIYFTVSAEHTVDPANLELTSLEATQSESDLESGAAASFDVTLKDGEVSTDIVNKAGVELPETGGIGTTIFYIAGAILVLAAVVFLVTRKRMGTREE